MAWWEGNALYITLFVAGFVLILIVFIEIIYLCCRKPTKSDTSSGSKNITVRSAWRRGSKPATSKTSKTNSSEMEEKKALEDEVATPIASSMMKRPYSRKYKNLSTDLSKMPDIFMVDKCPFFDDELATFYTQEMGANAAIVEGPSPVNLLPLPAASVHENLPIKNPMKDADQNVLLTVPVTNEVNVNIKRIQHLATAKPENDTNQPFKNEKKRVRVKKSTI